MKDTYLKLVEGFEQLAQCYRALAGEPEHTSPRNVDTQPVPKVTIEQVRAVLAGKSQEGKTRQVKALLLKYDAGKLSGVKPEDYPALLQEAEAL